MFCFAGWPILGACWYVDSVLVEGCPVRRGNTVIIQRFCDTMHVVYRHMKKKWNDFVDTSSMLDIGFSLYGLLIRPVDQRISLQEIGSDNRSTAGLHLSYM